MPRKKPGLTNSDRDVLRRRPSMDSTAEADYSAPPGAELGDTEHSIIVAMNQVFRDLSTQRIQKDTADPMISAARVTLNAVKSRDAKAKIALLEQMLKDAQRVANDGLKREAEDRHHVTRTVETKPAADAGG